MSSFVSWQLTLKLDSDPTFQEKVNDGVRFVGEDGGRFHPKIFHRLGVEVLVGRADDGVVEGDDEADSHLPGLAGVELGAAGEPGHRLDNGRCPD